MILSGLCAVIASQKLPKQNIARGTTDPEIDSVVISLIANVKKGNCRSNTFQKFLLQF